MNRRRVIAVTVGVAALLVGALVAASIPALRTNGVEMATNSSTPVTAGKDGVWVDTSNRLRFDDGTNSNIVATAQLASKGDIVGYTGSAAGVLAVGTNGQLPVADSSATYGITWRALTASDWTGTVPIAKGGTNSASALSSSSIMISNGSAIIQGAAGTSTQVLHGNASGAPTMSAVALGTDVSGQLPAANGGTGLSSAGAIANRALYTSDGVTFTVGQLPNACLANTSFTLNAGTGETGTATCTLGGSCTAPATSYGTTSSTSCQGNDTRLLPSPSDNGGAPYDTGSGWARLAHGTAGQVYTSGGAGAPTWTTPTTGTVTSVTCGTGLTGGAITSSGTCAVSYGTAASTTCQGNDSRLAPAPGTKGKIIVDNGTSYTTLAVGSDTQILTADSSQSTGVKWAAPAAGGQTVADTVGTATLNTSSCSNVALFTYTLPSGKTASIRVYVSMSVGGAGGGSFDVTASYWNNAGTATQIGTAQNSHIGGGSVGWSASGAVITFGVNDTCLSSDWKAYYEIIVAP